MIRPVIALFLFGAFDSVLADHIQPLRLLRGWTVLDLYRSSRMNNNWPEVKDVLRDLRSRPEDLKRFFNELPKATQLKFDEFGMIVTDDWMDPWGPIILKEIDQGPFSFAEKVDLSLTTFLWDQELIRTQRHHTIDAQWMPSIYFMRSASHHSTAQTIALSDYINLIKRVSRSNQTPGNLLGFYRETRRDFLEMRPSFDDLAVLAEELETRDIAHHLRLAFESDVQYPALVEEQRQWELYWNQLFYEVGTKVKPLHNSIVRRMTGLNIDGSSPILCRESIVKAYRKMGKR